MRRGFPLIIPVVFDRLAREWSRLKARITSPLLAWFWGVRRSGPVMFQGKTFIRTLRKGQIVLGSRVVFNSDFRCNLVGLTNPTVLDTRFGGSIEVGDSSGFSSVVISSKSSVRIGRHVKVGGNVRIFDHDFHSTNAGERRSSQDRMCARTAPVVIGDDVFIGANAIILKGSVIGARSIVAAGSVVFGLNVPPDSLVKGNPACVISAKGDGRE